MWLGRDTMIFEAEKDKVARHLASSNQNDVERKLDDSITLLYGDNLSVCWSPFLGGETRE